MIKIEVDEAYAFDYLSILYIKSVSSYGINSIPYLNCRSFLMQQLGVDFFKQITDSKEYDTLVEANRHTFRLIDLLRANNPISGREIDDSNMVRYKAKIALQSKFFPTKELTEKKI